MCWFIKLVFLVFGTFNFCTSAKPKEKHKYSDMQIISKVLVDVISTIVSSVAEQKQKTEANATIRDIVRPNLSSDLIDLDEGYSKVRIDPLTAAKYQLSKIRYGTKADIPHDMASVTSNVITNSITASEPNQEEYLLGDEEVIPENTSIVQTDDITATITTVKDTTEDTDVESDSITTAKLPSAKNGLNDADVIPHDMVTTISDANTNTSSNDDAETRLSDVIVIPDDMSYAWSDIFANPITALNNFIILLIDYLNLLGLLLFHIIVSLIAVSIQAITELFFMALVF